MIRTALATRTALAACVALLLLGGVALAAVAPPGTYKGKTKQKRRVSVQVGDAAKVQELDINWRAKCKKPNKFWTGGTKFTNPTGTTDSFSASGGAYTAQAGGGFSGIITPKLTGKFTTAAKANGTFKAHVRVEKNGKKVDSCNVSTKWHAKSS